MIAVIKVQKYGKNRRYSIVKHRFVGSFKRIDMIIVNNQEETQKAIQRLKSDNNAMKVGFIPTMGALHEGHMSLIRLAKETADIVVCSIFVNPTQFNNSNDLAVYPRTEEADAALLEANGCDILLLPTVKDVYPDSTKKYEIDLEGLDLGMEGEFREGHFNGVCMVVERFFEMVKPDKAYFGLKDFQQISIVRKMVEIRGLKVDVVGAPIKRDDFGLALSSRNLLLTEEERRDASLIYRSLRGGLDCFEKSNNANTIEKAIRKFYEGSELEVEYIAIVNNKTLQEVDIVDKESSVCIAVFYKGVRLIDNMQFHG